MPTLHLNIEKKGNDAALLHGLLAGRVDGGGACRRLHALQLPLELSGYFYTEPVCFVARPHHPLTRGIDRTNVWHTGGECLASRPIGIDNALVDQWRRNRKTPLVGVNERRHQFAAKQRYDLYSLSHGWRNAMPAGSAPAICKLCQN